MVFTEVVGGVEVDFITVSKDESQYGTLVREHRCWLAFLCPHWHFWDTSFFSFSLGNIRLKENLEHTSLCHFLESEVPSLSALFPCTSQGSSVFILYIMHSIVRVLSGRNRKTYIYSIFLESEI